MTAGLTLPGWTCHAAVEITKMGATASRPCGVFNSDAKERLTECRACGAARPVTYTPTASALFDEMHGAAPRPPEHALSVEGNEIKVKVSVDPTALGRQTLIDLYGEAIDLRDRYFENLTETQKRCSTLLEEARASRRDRPGVQAVAMARVLAERDRQDAKWNRTPGNWPMRNSVKMCVLMEEVGELAQALLDGPNAETAMSAHAENELVQVAAVSLAMLECVSPVEARPPRIYVAAPYPERDRAIEVMRWLEDEVGCEVTSTWLRIQENDATAEDRRRCADLDLLDVARADAVLAVTRGCRERGHDPRGTLVEIGGALLAKKPVVWMGDDAGECIFNWSTGVTRVATLGEAEAALRERFPRLAFTLPGGT